MTGRRVYPPISEASAAILAGLVLAAAMLVVRIYRRDRQPIPPTPRERALMADGIRRVVHRRANAVGAVDDVLTVVGALGAYVRRAVTEPARRESAPEPEPHPPGASTISEPTP